jgi:hypothetical protein
VLLAEDVRLGALTLRVERIELLLEALEAMNSFAISQPAFRRR